MHKNKYSFFDKNWFTFLSLSTNKKCYVSLVLTIKHGKS
jgi:hypothetical protein